jgi:hypothetical protein
MNNLEQAESTFFELEYDMLLIKTTLMQAKVHFATQDYILCREKAISALNNSKEV